MRMLVSLLVLAASSLSLQAEAAPLEKVDFRGVGIGVAGDAALPAFLAQFAECKHVAASMNGMCNVQFPALGSIRAEMISLRVRDKGLHSVLMTFSPRQFADVADAMIAKLGPPTSDTTETLQNGYGATFEGRSLTWNSADGTLVSCRQYGGRADRSIVAYYSKEIQAVMLGNKPKASDL